MKAAGVLGVALGAALALAGGGLLARGTITDPTNAGAVPSGAAPAHSVPTTHASPSTSTPPPDPGSPPADLRITALGVDAPVQPVGVSPDGTLGVPDHPDTLGWWSAGAKPGSATGTVVIDGHIDSARYGFGALYRLSETPIGSPIVVRTQDGHQLTYRVVALRTYPKSGLPADTFTQSSQPRLVLISCTGSFNWNTHHYSDNIVAYAVPSGASAPAR